MVSFVRLNWWDVIFLSWKVVMLLGGIQFVVENTLSVSLYALVWLNPTRAFPVSLAFGSFQGVL